MTNILGITYTLLERDLSIHKTFTILKKTKTITMKKIAFVFTLIFLFAASISLIINLVMKQWEPSLWIFISIVWAANTALYQYMDIYSDKRKEIL